MMTRKRALASLDLEIKQHIEEATRDHLARGLSQEEARRAALREFDRSLPNWAWIASVCAVIQELTAS
jgi:hypothetical protein